MQPDMNPQHALARRLCELSDAAAQPYGFGEFQRRAARRTERHGVAAGPALAAAVVAVVVAALSLRFGVPHGAADAPEPGRAAAPTAAAEAARTAAMEHWLASLPSDRALVRVGPHAAVTGLEDRIAQVDDLLSAARAGQAQPAHLSALQEERARLVGALVQVRYAETLADQSL